MSDDNRIELLEIKIDIEKKRIISYAAGCVGERLESYILKAVLERARRELRLDLK